MIILRISKLKKYFKNTCSTEIEIHLRMIFCIAAVLSVVVYSIFSGTAHAENEKYYQEKYCTGKLEVRLDDMTRVDCVTGDYAIEYDFAKKWAEAIGQALHYGRMTGKLPGIVLIIESVKDCKYVKRTQANIDHYWLPIRLQTVGVTCQYLPVKNLGITNSPYTGKNLSL